MNLEYIQYNMQEIQEEIELILKGIKRGENYAHDEYYKSMQHLIHHVNIAWNTRNATTEEIESHDLSYWSQFPTDINLI